MPTNHPITTRRPRGSTDPGTARRSRLAVAAVVVFALGMVASCSSDDADDAGEQSTTTEGTTVGSLVDDTSTSTTTSAAPDTSDAGDTDGGSDGDSADLPGEPWDGFAQDGDTLAVLGVASDDVLNIRSIPGTDGDIIATAAPTAADLVATGRARALPASFWYEVTVGDVTGWAAVAFLAFEAGTDDVTAEYLSDNERPVAAEMGDLGLVVAQAFASEDPPSDVVISVAPTVGDLGEVTVDVVGLGDDAGAGYRLVVFAEETEGGFSLRSIERTNYCTRGVSGEFCL
jgi:hypothetical protein